MKKIRMTQIASVFGIIALTAVIGFMFIACDEPNGNGDKELSGNITISPSGSVHTGTTLNAAYDGQEDVTYQWNRNGSAIQDATGTAYTPTEAGSYSVTVSAAGFKSKTSTAVTVTNLPPDTVATPTADPLSGAVASGTQITLATITEGASIRYTIDGSAPTETSGTLYTTPIAITTAVTIRAIAYKDGMINSGILTAEYTIIVNKVITPAANPPSGAVASGTQITLATATEGASIRYTVNGDNPTATSGIVYTSAIPITVATTIRAIAYKDGMTDSDILTASYTIAVTGGCQCEGDSYECECVDCQCECGGCEADPCEAGHTFGEWNVTTAPTCSATGTGTRVCVVCDKPDTNTTIPIDPDNHEWIDNWEATTPATCSAEGEETRVCYGTGCEHYEKRPIAALPHTFTEWQLNAIHASFISPSKDIEKCSGCNELGTNMRDGTDPQIPITNRTDFEYALAVLENNTAEDPYHFIVNIDNLGGDIYQVRSIGNTLFSSQQKFVSLDMTGSTFTSIVTNAFLDRTNLTAITIPDSVRTIGTRAFNGCTGLTSVTIGNSVTSIGEGAFQTCTSLTSIDIPNSVITIGERAFNGCTNLMSVTIGNSVTTIGAGAFNACTSLMSITVDPNNLHFASIDGVLYDKSITHLIRAPIAAMIGSFTIPDSVTTIGDWAFFGCAGLTNVTIGNKVTIIGAGAFAACASLTEITIPDSAIYIGGSAFSNCTSLASVDLGNGIYGIGQHAFSSCTSLTSIVIPDNVTSIGSFAFSDCTNLKEVTLKRFTTDDPPITMLNERPFIGTHADLIFKVPAAGVEAYRADRHWLTVVDGDISRIVADE